MQSGNGSAGTLRFAARRRGKRDRWAVETLAQSSSQYANYTLMPGWIVQADTEIVGDIDFVHQRQRGCLHSGLYVASFAIQRIKLFGQFDGFDLILRQQAFDADRHVAETAGRVQPWTEYEAQIICRHAGRVPAGNTDQRVDTSVRAPCTYALQTLMHQNAIIVVQPYDIGDGTECDQVQQSGKVWFLALFEPVAPA